MKEISRLVRTVGDAWYDESSFHFHSYTILLIFAPTAHSHIKQPFSALASSTPQQGKCNLCGLGRRRLTKPSAPWVFASIPPDISPSFSLSSTRIFTQKNARGLSAWSETWCQILWRALQEEAMVYRQLAPICFRVSQMPGLPCPGRWRKKTLETIRGSGESRVAGEGAVTLYQLWCLEKRSWSRETAGIPLSQSGPGCLAK